MIARRHRFCRCLEDYVDADNPARVIEAFVEALDLGRLGFATVPASTGRPSYHPATLQKLKALEAAVEASPDN
jgi:transposase